MGEIRVWPLILVRSGGDSHKLYWKDTPRKKLEGKYQDLVIYTMIKKNIFFCLEVVLLSVFHRSSELEYLNPLRWLHLKMKGSRGSCRKWSTLF